MKTQTTAITATTAIISPERGLEKGKKVQHPMKNKITTKMIKRERKKTRKKKEK